jgi:bifunctional ADP-heptose synthase (sugar kinase/adenylyltransferase)
MKVLVIGDSCIDTFHYGDVVRLSPEAPVPVIVPKTTTMSPGMAGNVAANLRSLKINTTFITNKNKLIKNRYICNRYHYILLRVDINDTCKRISKKVLQSINFKEYDCVVISDYCKGFLTTNDIFYISQSHSLTFLDTKKELGDWVKDISFLKINFTEYTNNKNIIDNNTYLQNKTIITRGEHGCNFQGKNYPTKKVAVKDVSGAGDTFLAGLVVKYLQTKNIHKAINFAQKCTTIVVQKAGVSTV